MGFESWREDIDKRGMWEGEEENGSGCGCGLHRGTRIGGHDD